MANAANNKHLGKDFLPPDVIAKVTGEAKYAEDFRADGMVFARLLSSPYPHARVRSIDLSEAEKVPGYVGVLLPEDVNNPAPPESPLLTMEPGYIGSAILLLAAESETAAQDAIDKVRIDYEPLPFHLDPLVSLRPDGPDAHTGGNVGGAGVELQTIKWTNEDFANAPAGAMPMGKAAQEWTYGDLDAGFAQAKLIIDTPFVHASNSHHSMEPRTAMAYWQNGKCILHVSSQSQSFILPAVAGMIGIPPSDLVIIAEFCGGGFGSKGAAYTLQALPALLSKKLNRPVMMRISRAEEYYHGAARMGFQGQVKLGFAEDGRLLAADLYIIQENGAYASFPDFRNAADGLSLMYQPAAMRWRGLPVFANSPWRTAQRGPGYNQIMHIMEPLLDQAARELNIDRLQIRLKNSPERKGVFGSRRTAVTSCYVREALERGAQIFNWEEKLRLHGQRNGSKITSVAVGQAFHPAGFTGFDGLVRILPTGKVHIHTGVGNLGTFSHSSTSRIAAEVLKVDWDDCVIERGDSRRHLPWNIGQFGSNTNFTMARTNFVAATDAVNKLKAIAARRLGGNAEQYDVDGKRVFRRGSPGTGLTYAQAAQLAIQYGGSFDGHELPEDINAMTKESAAALAGTGLIGVAKDTLPVDGAPSAFAVGFVQIELDLETGKHTIVDYVGVADCGTVIHPAGLETQIKSGAVQGFSVAALERIVYDPQIGLPASIGYYQAKPATYGDVAHRFHTSAVDSPDPSSPLGTKGIGEPLLGCAASALLCAISEAVGGHVFNRTPIVPDMILNHLHGRPQAHGPLQVNCQ
ncbi:MAG: xanthine dehydrogenase family protein molybdopterin-binding subunit [Nevskiaceae bacterium]|jgi:CO/xanthine dehydrogenase Mo-binding subunit|nr:xanthine dehydrogenase family protein molybdopterin-binding subunit [Nevskiaceae bacterium]